MFVSEGGASLHFDAMGHGPTVLILHGAYSTRDETRAAFEPVLERLDTCRRIYLDLPAMGDSPAHDTVRTSQAVVDLLEEFIDHEIGGAPLRLIGHSYGGHLARGLAARRTPQVAGLCLVSPLVPTAMTGDPHRVVERAGDPSEWLDADLIDDFVGYFVIHTPQTAERFRAAVAPAIGRFDADRVAEMMSAWRLDPDPDSSPLDMPTLIMSGRHDSLVGHRGQMDLMDLYPDATVVAVADAGHALVHERPDLLAAHVRNWDERCRTPRVTPDPNQRST